MSAASGALDTLRSVTTPEGVELNLRLAGPVPRACAWMLDLVLRFAVMIALQIGTAPLGGLGFGLSLLAAFLLEWFYPVVFEIWYDGATPGKKAMGLRVVNDDGTPVQPAAAVVRNLLRAVDFLPMLYGVGLVAMLANRDFKRLGDIVAQTVVVYRDEKRVAVSIPAALPIAPAVPLALEEARAILDYAERASGLTPERADELARIAEPLLAPGEEDARGRLTAVANYLVGRTGR